MKTVTIQIGNTDDKLSQREWSEFAMLADKIIHTYCREIHFHGCSNPVAFWQNCAWVVNCPTDNLKPLAADLVKLRTMFKQDSVAWTEGETLFL